MMELRPVPKEERLTKLQWENLYVLTNHWISDLEFYKDELRFLRNLINRYFKWLVQDENIARVEALTERLTRLNIQQREISDRVHKHLSKLRILAEYSPEMNRDFRDSHSSIEEQLATFVKSFRSLKKEVFALTEEVTESENLRHHLK